ncbi:MAG: sterol desaturase family protein [Cyanobacteria bacterium P01_F01_bin.150]
MKRLYHLLIRRISIIQLCISAGIIALLLVLAVHAAGLGFLERLYSAASGGYIAHAIWDACRSVIKDVILNPILYGLVLGILVLEKLMPVDPKQKSLSSGFVQDFIWFIGDFFLQALLLIPFFIFIQFFYGQSLSEISINVPRILQLPGWVTLFLAIVLTDFCAWLAHVLQHRIPFLWRFHAVHHSQHEMNLFTNNRFHFGDALIAYPLQILPLYCLLIPLPHGVYYVFFRHWYPRLYHANVRANFGILRYILVTPQSHRLHHSSDPSHFDHNFGVIFSVWDRIFGTQYQNHHIYPDTGVDDLNFPVETHLSLWELPKNYLTQLGYPFFLGNRKVAS